METEPQAHRRTARTLCAMGRSAARARNLSPCDAEDCAVEFAEHVLLQAAFGTPSLPPPSWLCRCAANFAANRRRNLARRAAHELPWPEREDAEGRPRPLEVPAPSVPLECAAADAELRRRLLAALDRLPLPQRTLVIRHTVEGLPFSELAQETQRTPDAVRVSFSRACRRLRGILERQGFDETEADEYLAMLAPLPP